MAKATQQRFFATGEKVKVAKKSRVVDKQRGQEGVARKSCRSKGPALPPIDVDAMGWEGEVCAGPYENAKRGEVLVPIRLPNQAVIAVPENRLERTEASPPPGVQRAMEQAAGPGGGGVGSVSPATIEFWRNHFANEAAAKKLNEKEG